MPPVRGCALVKVPIRGCVPVATYERRPRLPSDALLFPALSQPAATHPPALPTARRPISSVLPRDGWVVAMNAGIFVHCLLAYQIILNVWSSSLLHIAMPQ